jgi:outer membrane protein OmpA-like peptidoglycan-associated protein
MRTVPVILAGMLLGSVPARAQMMAQVTMNQGALDALPRQKPHRRPAPHRTPHPAPQAQPAPPSAAPPATPPPPQVAAPAKPAKPAIPTTPPAILALPPPTPVPLAHPPPPPTVPVAEDAPGEARAIAGGVRVTFGPDRFDLNPATVAALRDFARGLADKDATSINIYAYAAGSPEDPSTPRRLSLERALAARAVLLDEGIASPRIYPRALGPAGGSADPDRVDVVAGPPTPPAAQGRAG